MCMYRVRRKHNLVIACTFVTGEDRSWIRATERMIGEPIARKKVSGFECDIDSEPETKSSSRGNGRGGARGNGGGRGGASRGNGGGRSRRGRR